MLDEVEIRKLKTMDAVALLSGVLPMTDRGRPRFSKCLWHDDDNASMAVYENGVYCFACGHKDDVLGVVRKIYGVSLKRAYEWIMDRNRPTSPLPALPLPA